MADRRGVDPETKARIRSAFDGAAPRYDERAVLQHQVATDLDERLDLVRLAPRRILDIGTGTGRLTEALGRRYPDARIVAADLAPGMVAAARARVGRRRRWPWRAPRFAFAVADIEGLPFADAGFDLVTSNVTLQWCPDPTVAFEEVRRVLRPGGLFMFSTFGPDTLWELRRAWETVDGGAHVNGFPDMHDLGDELVRAQFADPVMDTAHFTLTYTDVRALMRDLKGIGAHTVLGGRRSGLMGRGALAALEAAYEPLRQCDRLPSTWEVVHGHAWVPETPRQQRRGETTTVSLEQVRGTVNRP